MVDELKDGKNVDSIAIVRKFIDMFPKDLPRLPLDQEIEFVIDVTPGTESILITPYYMTPAELNELKI